MRELMHSALLLLAAALAFHVTLAQQLATRGDFSVVTGAALSVATAGTAATFTITAKDESGNARTSGGDNFVVTLDGDEPYSLTVTDNLNGLYTVSYLSRLSGSPQLSVALAQGGGLWASYFENVWFFYTPVLERVDPQINFDWGSGAITPSAMDYVSVRWTGRVLPQYTETYTFYADANDGVRLWVNGVQLIDRWEGGANMTAAKVSLSASNFYRIKVEYKDVTGPARMSLYWSSPSTLKDIIPASQLFYEIPCKSIPLALTVMPAVSCATTSVASGSGLASSATAGVFASFAVESHDAFSNYRNVGGDIIAAHLFPSSTSARAVQSAITDNADGTYFATFKPFTSGDTNLGVQYLTLGGLYATMYTDVGYKQSISTVAVTSIDFTKTGTPYISATDTSNDSLFSIRYAGFFKASVTGTHTFQVALAYLGENYLLYIDNFLAIDASSGSILAARSATISLVSTNYYSVQLNYISSSATAGDRKVALSVINPTPTTFSPAQLSANMYQSFHVTGSPFAIAVSPARMCASLSIVTDGTGDALSIATAGLSAVFTITTKDLYGNLRGTGNNKDSFRITLAGTSGASGTAVSNSDGTYRVIYAVTQSGTYDLSVVFGSAPVGNSPFKIWAQPAGRLLKNSPVKGSGLTLLTAGIPASITITVRDGFSNWQPQPSVSTKIKLELQDATNIAVTYCSSTNCPSFASGSFVANPVTLDNPRYVASFTVTKAGTYSFAIYGLDAFDTHIIGSPFQLTVLPAVFNDASISDFQPTSSIAGFPSFFSTQTFDSYGNVCYDCTQVLSVFTRLSSFRDILGTSSLTAPSRYNAAYTATKSQTNNVNVVFGTAAGILATYYSGTSYGYANAVLAIKVPDIDFSLAASSSYQGISGTFSAKYAGLFRATSSGTATFKLAHKSATDSYKLTMSNVVIATMSSGSAAATTSYTVTRMVANQLYDIVFEYIASNSADVHGIAFSVNMGSGDTKITSQNVFASRSASFSNTAFTAAPSTVCASLLTRQTGGHSLSIVTAGGFTSFTIQSKDLFNNIRTVNIDDGIKYALVSGGYVPPVSATSAFLNMQATALDGGRDAFVGTVDATSGGVYTVKYSATLSGVYQLSGRVHRPGGLYGLYFETDSLQDNSLTPSLAVASQPTFQRLDSQINFRWGVDKPVDTLDSYYAPFSSKSIGPDFFSVRWYGSVLAPLSEVFTFSAEADDGVRLYIDNLLIINQWEFKSGVVDGTIALVSGSLYPIKLEYKEAQNNATIVLMWSSRSLPQAVIPSSSLFYTITSGPISCQTVYVPPAAACHTFSSVYGPGLTVATAGMPAYFTIQSLDSYGNHRLLMDSPYYYARFSPITTNTQLRPYKSQFTGLTSASGLTSSIERIANPRFTGGLTATYYTAGSFPNGGVVSCQNVAWLPANGCGSVDLASFVSSSGPFTLVGLGTMAGSALTARWAGYFQPTSSGQYRFFIGKSATTTAGFSISSTSGGSSPLALITGNTAVNPSASVYLVANAFYEVTVQFDQSSTSDLVCKLQYVYEPPGAAASIYSSSTLVPTANMFPLAARYKVMYTAPTVKGDFSPEVSLAVLGGLDATFYDDMSFVYPRTTVLHTLIDFTSTSFASNVMRVSTSGLSDVGYGAGVNVSDFNSFSARWQGFFKATQSETTFSISIRESDERVRLWVDNLLLINSWEYALSALSFSATFGASFVDQSALRQSDFNSLFDVKIEYVQFAGDSGIKALLFTSANIYARRDITIPPPFPVYPAVTCAAKSRVRGSALTRATAGVPATFTIMSLDMYQNDRDIDGDVYVSRLYPVVCEFSSACSYLYGTVTSMGDSTYVVSYMGTKKGSYDIVTSLAIPSALSATYYGSSDFSGSRINAFKTYSSSVTMATTTGGVRYTGFIQPPTTGPLTFSVTTTASGTISIWLFDTRTATTANVVFTTATSGSSVMSFPTANAMYDVRVDLSSTTAALSLFWIYAGISVTSIPTDRVFARTDVPNTALGASSAPYSPASLMMVARDSCAAQSLSKGVGLTVTTAGAAASFTLTSRDAYANDRGLAEDAWVIRITGPSRLTVAAYGDTRPLSAASSLNAGSYANVVGPGRYSASYSLTVSGLYSIDVLLATTGGLKAEYYCNSWLSGTPCFTSIDPTIDFNWGLNAITPSNATQAVGSNFMSVRWSGYFMWETSDTVTFYTQTDEGVRLYVDGVAVIDQWDAIGSNFSASWSGSGVGGLYPIVIEYRESTDIAFCRLLYSTATAIQQPVPNALLFSSADHVFGSPFSTYTYAVATCVTTSTASLSPPFSIYTVGALTAITIITRDQYSNLRTDWDVTSPSIYVRTCAIDFSDYCKRASVTKSTALGSWTASFSATRAAATNVLASLVYTASASFRGMHATYYSSPIIGSAPIKSDVATLGSTTLSSDTVLAAWGTNTNPRPFSIRWAGVFVASTRGQYTFSVTVAASDSAVLYVNNIKVFDGWAGAQQALLGTVLLDAGVNAFYDIVLDYKRSVVSPSGSVSSFQYECCGAAAVAFTTAVMQPLAIAPSPIPVQYVAGPAVMQKSNLNGISLTISTAGNLAQFSVTSRDSFGNRRLVGGETMYLYVSKADGTVATTSIFDAGNGIYVGSYVPRVEGAYVVSTALGSSANAFSMTVFPNFVCASKCITTSNQLTVATAGYVGSFTVTMRDASSNYRTSFTDDFVAKMSGPSNELKNLPVTYSSNAFAFPYIPTYRASYRTSRSGIFSIDVRVATSNGLNASFFIDSDLSQLVLSRIDSSLSFDWGSGSPDAAVSAVDMFSAQWSGYVKPDYAGEYTFVTSIADIGDRVRLWVDDQYIINLWNVAPAGVSNSATIKLSSNTLYDIKLQYRDTSGNAAVTLTWIRNSIAAQPIPSSRLISSTAAVAGSPFTATVFPALTCGSLSTASGHGLSLATAGVPASFTITAYDHLGNRITHSLDVFTVRARNPSSSVADRVGTITATGNGLYSGVYTPTLKRNEATQWHDVPVSMGVLGGPLLATYYQNSDGALISTATTLTTDLASSVSPGGVAVAYNARYSCLIQPPSTSWVFSVLTSAAGLSVKIDGKELLTGVGATTIVGMANALYDIDISVTNVVSPFASPAIAINLAGTQQTLTVASGRVFQRHDLTFKTYDSSGLIATFYSAGSFSTALSTATVANIDWSYAANSPKYHSSAPSSGAYGVRWTSFVRPTMRDVYTFYIQKSAGETSVALTLDNGASVSIGNGATEGFATVFIPAANELYEVSIQLLTTNSANALFRLLWFNDGNTYANYDRPAASPSFSVKTVIGSDSLFRIRTLSRVNREDQSRYFNAAGWPDCGSTATPGNLLRWYQCRGSGVRFNDMPNVEVRVSSSCGSKSTIVSTNVYVSLSTVGVLSSFDILTNDQYDNILDGSNAAVTVLGSQQSGVSAGKFYGSALPTSLNTDQANPSGRYTVAYMATVAGSYLLNVGVADSVGNGLRGVYYSSSSLGGQAVSNQIDALLNFTWGASPPVPLLPSAVGWSARWTGFIRLTDAASNEFTFYLRTGAGGGRVYVANALVVDSTSAASAGEYSGTKSLQNNVVYDIVVEYIASAIPTFVQLSYASPSNPKQVYPSGGLYPFSGNLMNGARTLVINHGTICGALSLKSGRGLSIATAGIAAQFRLTSIDQYGNFRSDQSNVADCNSQVPTCFFSATVIPAKPSLSPTTRSFQAAITQHNANNFFNVQYTVTAAGSYSVAASASPSSGGLFATYYDDLLFAIPRAAQLEASPGWQLSSTAVPTVSASPLTPDGLFSVRLGGLFKPAATGAHTFVASHSEMLSVYVDGVLLIDQSTYSGGVVSRSGVISLPSANAFYDITVLYSSDALSGSELSGLSINGNSFSSMTGSLYASLPVGTASSFIVYPNVPCGARSTIRGYGLTVATAGASVLLTITVRDEYYNFRTQVADTVVVRAFALTGSSITPAPNFFNAGGVNSGATCVGCPTAPVPAAITGSSNSLYTVSLLLTVAGNYKVAASLARKGGLIATFYAQDSAFAYASGVSATAAFATLDYSSASAVSGRWQGFIQPSQAGTYTFTVVPVTSTNEFIKLWVNQALVIDRTVTIPATGFSATYSFAAANALYDIFVAYSTAGGGFNMYWERMGSATASADVPRQSIPSTRLYSRDDASGDGWTAVAAATVFHTLGCGATSIVTGLAVTLTAGVASAFTISSRDAYSNVRTIGSDFTFNSLSVRSSGSPTVYGSVSYAGAAGCAYNSDRTLTVSGTYYMHIRGGGVHVQGSPFTITLLPAQECSSTSLAFGAGLTVTTVNIASSYYIQARDAWGNTRTVPNVQSTTIYVARAFTSSIGSNPETTNSAPYIATTSTNAMEAYWQLPSWYVGAYQFTAAPAQGNYGYFRGVSMATLGGFIVTYYHNLATVDALVSSGTPLKTAVDRFSSSNTVPATSNVFAARWSGFIRSTTSALVTWSAFAQSGTVKGKIWVNGGAAAYGSPSGDGGVSAVFTTVANTLYQVQVEYKCATASAVALDAFGAAVATSNMYADFSITGSPTALAVY